MIKRLQTLAQYRSSNPDIIGALASVQREFDNIYRNLDQTKVTVAPGSGLTISGQEIGADIASAQKTGMLSAADWIRFNAATVAPSQVSAAERAAWNNAAGTVAAGSANWDAAYAHSIDVTGNVHGATASNTANMIVRRDASGDFSARDITAGNLVIDGANNRIYAGNTNGAIDIRANGTGEYAIGYNTGGATPGAFNWYGGQTTPQVRFTVNPGSGSDISVYNADSSSIVISGLYKRIYFPVGGTEFLGTAWVAGAAAQTLEVQTNGGKFWVGRWSDNAELFSVLDSNGNTYVAGLLTVMGGIGDDGTGNWSITSAGVGTFTSATIAGGVQIDFSNDPRITAVQPQDLQIVGTTDAIGGNGTNVYISGGPEIGPNGDGQLRLAYGFDDQTAVYRKIGKVVVGAAALPIGTYLVEIVSPGLYTTDLRIGSLSGILKASTGVVSGGAAMEDLSNVNVSGIVNGQTLVWDNATSKWINSSAGSGTIAGSGTVGTIPKFVTNTTTIGDSLLLAIVTGAKVSASSTGGAIEFGVENGGAIVAGTVAQLFLSVTGNTQKTYTLRHYQNSGTNNDSKLQLLDPSGTSRLELDRSGVLSVITTLKIASLSGVLKASTGTVSGGAALNDLSDLNAPTPSGGDLLQWDAGTSKWKNAALSGIAGSGTVGTVAKFVTNTTTIGDSLLVETTNTMLATDSKSGGPVTLGVSNTVAKAANNVAAIQLTLSTNTQASFIWKHLQNSTTDNDSDLRLYVPDGTLAITINRAKAVTFAGAIYCGTSSIYGLTSAGGQLSIYSTSHATKGNINLDTYFSYYGSNQQLVLTKSGVSPTYGQVSINATAGVMGLLTYNSDNVVLTFDAEWTNGNWVARHTSAFGIEKSGAYLKFKGNASLVSGNTFTPTVQCQMAPGGTWTFGGTASPTTAITIDNIGSYGSRRTDVASATNLTDVSTASSYVNITGSTATALHGFASPANGKIVILINSCSQNVTIKNQSATESTAANRIIAATGADHIVLPNDAAAFIYDSGQSRWIQWA